MGLLVAKPLNGAQVYLQRHPKHCRCIWMSSNELLSSWPQQCSLPHYFMIKSFADQRSEQLFEGKLVKKIDKNLQKKALRRLRYIDAAEFKKVVQPFHPA